MPSVSTGRFPEPVLAEKFLEKKIDAPTVRWDDLKWGEHAHAFTVAHSNEAAVLDTIHGLLNKAVKEGLGFQDFRNGMLDMMKGKGWYGGAGRTADDRKYINWRIKTIYETNMRTACAGPVPETVAGGSSASCMGVSVAVIGEEPKAGTHSPARKSLPLR